MFYVFRNLFSADPHFLFPLPFFFSGTVTRGFQIDPCGSALEFGYLKNDLDFNFPLSIFKRGFQKEKGVKTLSSEGYLRYDLPFFSPAIEKVADSKISSSINRNFFITTISPHSSVFDHFFEP
jgi:hypothetical protein